MIKARNKPSKPKRVARQPRPSNFASRMAQIDRDFDQVCVVAKDAKKNEDTWRASLYVALEATFDFGEELRKEQALLEEFLKKHEGAWNKRTQENPYIAIVKLAFSYLGEASVSQYSRVLRFAHDQAVPPQSLKVWLGDYGGIEGRYTESVEYYNPPKTEENASIRERQLGEARKHLDSRLLGPPIELTTPCSGDGYATALVRIRKSGTEVELVEWLEQEGPKLDPVLLRFSPAARNKQTAQSGKVLWRFHRAVDLVSSITPAQNGKHERFILVENALDDGKPICRVSSVSEAQSFPCARVKLHGFVEGIDEAGSWLLTAADAAEFVRAFQLPGDWELRADAKAAGAYVLANPSRGLPLPPWSAASRKPKLQMATIPRLGDKSFGLSEDKCAAFLEWNAEMMNSFDKRNNKLKVPRGKPKRLTMTISGRDVGFSIGEIVGPVIDVLELKNTGTISAERWLSIEDFVTVCTTFKRYELPAWGRFVSMQAGVLDGAIEIKADLGDDNLEVWLPLVINDMMNYAAICDEIK